MASINAPQLFCRWQHHNANALMMSVISVSRFNIVKQRIGLLLSGDLLSECLLVSIVRLSKMPLC